MSNERKNLTTNKEYLKLLSGIKTRIQSARISASQSVNRELILLYWSIGEAIIKKQKNEGWGKSAVEQLSKDIQKNFPGINGYSPSNIWRMRQFYCEYSKPSNLAQLVRDLKTLLPELPLPHNFKKQSLSVLAQPVRDLKEQKEILLRILCSIPWGQNVLIIEKIKNFRERLYYLIASAAFGWSRNALLNQIKAKAYQRIIEESKANNFTTVLPLHLAEQAEEAMKSSYILEFLGLQGPVFEKTIESSLIIKLKDFILELGYGFCFIGNQYRLTLKAKEYFLDLLFYHRFLKCLVVFELKATEFKPEHAGKMDFYLNLLNDKEKAPDDNPSIGIILCAEKDSLEVEYSLKNKKNPIGVAEYQLYKKLPAKLKGFLPSPGDLKNIRIKLTDGDS